MPAWLDWILGVILLIVVVRVFFGIIGEVLGLLLNVLIVAIMFVALLFHAGASLVRAVWRRLFALKEDASEDA